MIDVNKENRACKGDSYEIDDALNTLIEGEPGEPAHRSMSRRALVKAAGASAAALVLAGSAGALAWFTGTDTKVNKLEFAQNLNVKVIEPAWDKVVEEGRNVNIVPGSVLPKNPKIKNLSDEFDGYMIVEIRVPTAVVEVFDPETMTVLPPERRPLFTYTAGGEWEELQSFTDGEEEVHRYGWPYPIAPGAETPAIFEEIVFANLADGQGQEGEHVVTATAYGIQSLSFENVKDAWVAYKLQNGIGDGEPVYDYMTKLIVNDDAITEGTSYQVLKIEAEEKAAQAVAETDDQVVFPIVPLVRDAAYAVVEEGKTVDEPIATFAATEDLIVPLPDEATVIGEVVRHPVDGTFQTGYFVNGKIPSSATAVVFTNAAMYLTEEDDDLSIEKNGAYIGRYDERTQTYTIGKSGGGTVVFNKSSNMMFKNKSNIATIAGLNNAIDTSAVVNMSEMFYRCGAIEEIDVSNFSTDKVTDMTSMFYECKQLSYLDVSGFDTQSVTSMKSMFYSCLSLESIDVSGFDTGKVRDSGFALMFNGCKKVKRLDVSGFKTGNATSLQGMFSNCSSLEAISTENFDVSKATSMREMFNGCLSLLEFNSFGTLTESNENMYQMFSNCRSLTKLDLVAFKTSKVTNMGNCFSGCESLEELDVSGFDTTAVENSAYMFWGCQNLKVIYSDKDWQANEALSSDNMFYRNPLLIGGAGTQAGDDYSSDVTYACIDDPDNGKPGYFTYKAAA